jgi:hypothetical protein
LVWNTIYVGFTPNPLKGALTVLRKLFGILFIQIAGIIPQRGYTSIARGNAPGNERSEYEAHDACGLKNEPALRRKIARCFYWHRQAAGQAFLFIR